MGSELRSVTMKFLLVLSLAAAVQAEADPGFAYTVGGHFLPYTVGHHPTLLHAPLVYTHTTGCQNVAGAVVPCALGGFPVLGVAAPAAAPEAAAVETVEREKREAEAVAEAVADPEADPWLLYGSHYGGPLAYGGHYGYGYHHALPYYFASAGECRNNQGSLVPCALGR